MRRSIAALAVAAALAVTLAAAGSATGSGAAGATVGTSTSRLGRILVDGRGRTLYLFEKDKGKTSTCYGACASIWPPVTTSGEPHAARGAHVGLLGTTRRKGGKLEVTYAGHPLYLYAGDQKRGDTNGEGLNQFGAKWYVLAPSGKKIDRD
jgi:predicted lipoprotein with Yx(FWY)xxD motif